MNNLYDALEAYAKEDVENIPEDFKFTLSDSFDEKMEKIIARSNSHKKKRSKKRFILIVAAILVLLFSFTVAAVQPLRDQFFHFIAQAYEKYTSFFLVSDAEYQVENTTMKSYLIGYLPDDFQLIDKNENIGCCIAVFQNQQQSLLVEQYNAEEYQSQIDTENALSENIQINSGQGILITKGEEHILIWNLDRYVFVITSTLNQPEMIRIAESLEIKESKK